MQFLDAQGELTSQIPPAHAWDAAIDPRSGEPLKVPVGLGVAQSGAGLAVLTVTPDAAWLADPARTFPITIDPSYASKTLTPSFDTWVATNYDFPNNDMSQDPELKVGTPDGGGTKARSYVSLTLASLKGLDVKSAALNLYETHSFSCTAKPLYAHNTAAVSTATRWSNQPSATSYGSSVSVAKGFSSSCAAGWVAVPITSMVQVWASNSWTGGTVRLSASETDSYGWKRFSSSEGAHAPYFSVTYNRKPNTPAMPAVASPPAVSYIPPGSTTPVLFEPDSTPAFSTAGSDPDMSDVKYTFEVHNTNTGLSSSTLKGSCTTGLVASGATASCALATALPENVIYYVRAIATDREGLVNTTASGLKQFRTSYGLPRVPTISCPAPYTNGSWQQNVPAANVSCTITANASGPDTNAASSISYKLDGASTATTVKFNQSTSATVAKATVVAANKRGGHSITATSTNPVGRVSAAASYSFGYGDANLIAPVAPSAGQRPVTTGAITVAAAGPPRGTSSAVSATVKWRLAGTSDNELTGWNTSPAALTKTQDDTGGVKFTGAWDTTTALEDLYVDSDPATTGVQKTVLNPRVPVQLDVQVCLSYTGSPAVTQCTWSDTASKMTITRVPHAFGDGFPTADAGPGQVALFTGEFNTSTTDVTVPGYSGALSLGRSASTYGNAPTAAIPVAQGVFGPGWTATLQGSDEGLSGLSVYDATHQDGTLAFVDEDGTAMIFAPANGARRTNAVIATGTWVAVDQETLESGIGLKVSGSGTSTRLELVEDDGTTTSFTAKYVAPATAKAAVFLPAGVSVPNAGSSAYDYDTTGRVTRILAPNPELGSNIATACPAGSEVPGCRALTISYGTTTSGASVTGQVSQVSLRIYNPTANLPVTSCAGATANQPVGMVTVPVACYTYDGNGTTPTKRLLSVKDPRNGLATTYTYGSQNELTSLTPPGQAAVTLGYATAEGRLKLSAVTRTLPASVVGGGAGTTSKLARFVYDAPLSGAGLPDMSAAGVSRWGQTVTPTKAFAVFGPDHAGLVPGEPGYASGVDWTRAELSYTTTDGYTVNTAGYGAGKWLPTRTDYDDAGRVIFTLDADAITRLIDAEQDTAASTDAAVDASPWGTTTIYNADTTTTSIPGVPAKSPAGSVVTDVYEPVRTIWRADGSNDPVRPHTHTDYDQGAPNAGIDPSTGIGYALATTITTTADPGESNQPGDPLGPVTGRTFSGYLDKTGSATSPTSGWTLRAATKSTTDMDLNGSVNAGDITATTYYDASGRTLESRQPAASGADAGTTLSTYYTAAANASDSTCGGKPQWAGLLCRTGPAAQPTISAAAPKLTNERTAGYSYLLAPTEVIETNGADNDATSARRTTTTTYLPDGRAATTATTVANVPGSTALDSTHIEYKDPTGQPTKIERKSGATVTGTITTTYDNWGRALSTTSSAASGDSSTTEYNALGQVAAVKDAKGTTRYTYDGPMVIDNDGTTVQERRGLVTKVTTTRVGLDETNPSNVLTYTGGYDVDGKLIRQTLPGGLVQQASYDEAGQQSELTYSGQVASYTETTDPDTGVTTYTPGPSALGPWLAWTQHRDEDGRVIREYNGQGAAFDGQPGTVDPSGTLPPTPLGQALAADIGYTYDQAGRLTRVHDRTSRSSGATINPDTPASATGDDAFPCDVRTYSFDANGNRTGQSSLTHTDGDCANTTNTTGASNLSYAYDAADRPTTSVDPDAGGSLTPTGSYVYDALGRQTTLPAADAPDPAKGAITLGYYDNDLPRSISQSIDGTPATTTATTITLDPADRRASSVTTRPDGTKTTTVRHYTDTGDNPAWSDTTTLSAAGAVTSTTSTRYTETLSGDLGAQIDGTGLTTLSLANPHGDNVTTVTIAAGASPTTNAVTIGSWADYTEYGQTTDATTPDALKSVGGTIGYGWLGANQGSTTDETAGLTLMGVRLYNNNRGLFTSVDPVTGGNSTAYTYPQDPINGFDLDGRCWGWGCEWIGRQVTRAYNYATNSSYRQRVNTRATRWVHRQQSRAVGAFSRFVVRRTGGSCSREFGMHVCRSSFRLYGAGGTTYGNTFVTARKRQLDSRIMNHEKKHRRQWNTIGWAMGPLYIAESIRTKFNPHRNRFERGAGLCDGGYCR